MSFSSKISPRRRTYVRLIGEISRALNAALEDEGRERGLTKTGIADSLGKNKSVISRLFAGSSNMTLETLADLAYALNRSVKIILAPNRSPAGSNREATTKIMSKFDIPETPAIPIPKPQGVPQASNVDEKTEDKVQMVYA